VTQTQINQTAWSRLISDDRYSYVSGRVETNRDGEVLLSSPPSPRHGSRQARIGFDLEKHLPKGIVVIACPVSTAKGVKVVDVAWFNSSREDEADADDLPERAPDICVEVVAPTDKLTDIDDRRALYFGAGAIEVWISDQDGRMYFFSPGGRLERSRLCCTASEKPEK
jgi:Uma2 family endonuclease